MKNPIKVWLVGINELAPIVFWALTSVVLLLVSAAILLLPPLTWAYAIKLGYFENTLFVRSVVTIVTFFYWFGLLLPFLVGVNETDG